MSSIDIFIIVVLGYGLVRGFMSGFVVQLAGVIGILLGLYVAVHFSDLLSNKLVDEYGVTQTSYLPLISFVVLFVATLVGIYFLGKFVKTLLKVAMMSIFDRIAGAILGLLKLAIVLGVLFNFLNRSEPEINLIPESTIQDSKLYQPVMTSSGFISNYLIQGASFIKQETENKMEAGGKSGEKNVEKNEDENEQ